jgi:hypothetical protein
MIPPDQERQKTEKRDGSYGEQQSEEKFGDQHPQTLRSALTTRMRMAPMPGRMPLAMPTTRAPWRSRRSKTEGARTKAGSRPFKARPAPES